MTDKIKSLYIHYPFCASKCGYCDFYSTTNKNLETRYLKTLKKELIHYFNMYDFSNLKTIYLGGGTPSLNLDFLTFITDIFLYSSITFNSIIEYTIETNPLNITKDFLDLCKKNYINRVSLGIQTFSEEALVFANRTNQNLDILNSAFELLKDYDFNVSIDLINGLPYSNVDFDLKSLKNLLNSYSFINHISIYDLSIDSGSIFYKDKVCGKNEKERRYYEKQIESLLSQFNFKKYEVSNYSKKGYESIHNKTYWQYDNYIGVGPSSHSTIGDIRVENCKDIKKYIECIEQGINGDCKTIQKLTKKEQIEEYLLMGLRLRDGIDIDAMNNRFAVDFESIFGEVLEKHIQNKNLIKAKYNIKTSKKGERILNKILVDFFIKLDNLNLFSLT